jgi:hypothetical protein
VQCLFEEVVQYALFRIFSTLTDFASLMMKRQQGCRTFFLFKSFSSLHFDGIEETTSLYSGL